MPAARYLPLAGKYGRVVANSAVMNLSEHEVRSQGDDIDTTHFESDVDAAGLNVFGEGLVGPVSAEIAIRGSFDGRNNPFETPFFLFAGMFGSIFCGLTKLYGFTMGYRCLRSPTTTRMKEQTRLEGSLMSNGLIYPPSGSFA